MYNWSLKEGGADTLGIVLGQLAASLHPPEYCHKSDSRAPAPYRVIATIRTAKLSVRRASLHPPEYCHKSDSRAPAPHKVIATIRTTKLKWAELNGGPCSILRNIATSRTAELMHHTEFLPQSGSPSSDGLNWMAGLAPSFGLLQRVKLLHHIELLPICHNQDSQAQMGWTEWRLAPSLNYCNKSDNQAPAPDSVIATIWPPSSDGPNWIAGLAPSCGILPQVGQPSSCFTFIATTVTP
jgi:hypothetical protein